MLRVFTAASGCRRGVIAGRVASRLLLITGALVVVLGAAPAPPAVEPPVGTGSPLAETEFPAWAYAWEPDYRAPPADNLPQSVPGSSRRFSAADARNLFLAPDWHPADHPRMPRVVARGRRPAVRACGVCHRAEGTGGPENSSLAGLPASYIVRQMTEFKSGARTFSGPRRSPVLLMIAVAKAATDAEVREAAAYFAAVRPKPLIKVVETDVVPQTYIAGSFRVIVPGGGREPIGPRIIEVPADVRRFELRDTRVTFRAFAPRGSITRGAALVNRPRAGTTVTCARCHGADLKGTAQVPGIAGRSPSYLVRQLQDFKSGARRGEGRPQMAATVEHLSSGDMLAVAAYLATLAP